MREPPFVELFCARFILPIGRPPIEDGALLVRNGRIAAVGRRDEVEVPAGTPATDFGDSILLPPLANAHTHLELTDFPRWKQEAGEKEDPVSFVDWILQMIRIKRGLDPSHFLPSVQHGITQSLQAGTGALGDILSWLPARRAYHAAPLRGRLFLEVLGRDPSVTRGFFSRILDLLRERQAGRLSLGLAPHSPYTLSAEYLEEVYGAARRQGVPTTTHLGESAEEAEFLQDSAGAFAERLYPAVGWEQMVPPPARRSPVAYLADRGGLAPWNLLVHAVQVFQKGDVERLAQSRATIVLCPRSNARLGVGTAPAAEFLRAGIPLALGTDSRGSCDSLSVWDEMAFARGQLHGVSPGELLKMATVHGSSALGLEGEMGRLAAGYGAHFQVLSPPCLPRVSELEEFLCTPGRTGEVASLFLDGRDVLQKP